MTLLLIRHGETPLNVARVLQPMDTPLSARGVEQAHALARRLAGMGITAILSSDLPRAHQTATLIAAATGAPIESSALLHERNFGDWRGLPYDQLPRDPLTMTEAAPAGESAAAFEARAAPAFALIVQRGTETDGALAVVTHGLLIGVLLGRHAHLPSGLVLPTHLGNTSLSVLAKAPPHTATLLNSTTHLDAGPGLADDQRALSGG